MDYMTVKQAAEKWGISERWVYKLCQDNRIEGQMRFATVWMIPANAEKPYVRRRKNVTPTGKSTRTEDKHDG